MKILCGKSTCVVGRQPQSTAIISDLKVRMVLPLFYLVSDGVDDLQGLAEILKVTLPPKSFAAAVNLSASVKRLKTGMGSSLTNMVQLR